jgi:hypothetical protein
VTKHGWSPLIFHLAVVGVGLALISIWGKPQGTLGFLLVLAFILIGPAYNWVTGFWRLLSALAQVTLVLGLALWFWHQSTSPDGEAASPWALILFLLPGLLLHNLDLALERMKQRRGSHPQAREVRAA